MCVSTCSARMHAWIRTWSALFMQAWHFQGLAQDPSSVRSDLEQACRAGP